MYRYKNLSKYYNNQYIMPIHNIDKQKFRHTTYIRSNMNVMLNNKHIILFFTKIFKFYYFILFFKDILYIKNLMSLNSSQYIYNLFIKTYVVLVTLYFI